MRALLALLTCATLTFGCGSSESTGTGSGGGGSTTSSSSSGTGGADAGPTTFPCKGLTCMYGTEACQVSNTPGKPDEGTCISLPPACMLEGAQCDCFGNLMTGCTCLKQVTGEFSIFCQVM